MYGNNVMAADRAQDIVRIRNVASTFLDHIKQGYSQTETFVESLRQNEQEVYSCLFPISGKDNPHDQNKELIEDIAREFLPSASNNGDLQTVCLLLKLGADVRKPGQKGTALEIATWHGYKNIIDECISKDPGVVSDIGQVTKCLFKACVGGHQNLMLMWLKYLKSSTDFRTQPSSLFTTDNDPIIAICKGGHLNLVDDLISNGIFVINEETILRVGDYMDQILQVWIKEGENNTLSACWTNKKFSHLEPMWLQSTRYSTDLTHVDLSYNALLMVPDILVWGLPALQTLNISHNKLTGVPSPTSPQQTIQSSLISLNISNNDLKVIPAEIFWLPKIEKILISHNHVQGVKPLNLQICNPVIEATYNLKVLILSHNNLAEFPDEIVQATKQIEKLDVSHNHLETIPSTLRCQHLGHLVVSNNRIVEFPEVIMTASKLHKLDLSENQLSKVPAYWDCPMYDLSLYHNNISEVPENHPLWQNTLKYLNMGKNILVEFPRALCRLASLEYLILKENRISQLPPTREWTMYNLKYLDISHNQLVHESLNFYARRPRASSTKWFRRRNVDEITLSLTEIELPHCVCASLTSLNLSNNALMDLPMSVCEMKLLQTLKLDGLQHMTSLPNELAKLDNLHSLSLEGTNIDHPPEVKKLKGETRATFKIKKILWNSLYDCETSRAMKLIIVGPEKSGKTHLLTRLTDTTWPEEDKGVNVQQWCLPSSVKQKKGDHGAITFTVWDLKGGESYTTINQSMLTPTTMYLLVWDLRNGEADSHKLRQWVLNIKSRSGNTRFCVVIVGTHLDKIRKPYVNNDDIGNDVGYNSHKMIGEKFPDLQDYMIDVDAETDDGYQSIVNLRKLIFDTASTMPYYSRRNAPEERFIGRQVPRTHLILRQRIAERLEEGLNPPIMTESELTTIIGTIPSHRIETPHDIEEAVRFLQDCGSVLCVSDHTYKLTRLYFLDPSWLCNALMDAMQVTNNAYGQQELVQGIVPTERLRDIGKSHGFTDEHVEDYLQLLARFEIALPHTKQRHLIPSLLPLKLVMNHVTSSTFDNTLYRWYKMRDIPAGFWSRLVSRIRVDIKRVDEESKEELVSPSFQSHGRLELKDAHVAVSQRDVFIRHNDGEIQVEPMRYPDNHTGIRVTVRCRDGQFRPMGFIVGHIENLIDEWYPALRDISSIQHVQCLVPCSVCIKIASKGTKENDAKDLDKYHVFPLEELAVAATIRKLECVSCHRHEDITVPLKELVPDLFLVDLDIHHLEERQLEVGEKLGQGGFGEVLSAKYRGERVAVKVFNKRTLNHSRDSDITEAEVLSVLDSFPKLRIEVAMMSRLRHPFILKLIGVSIQTLSFTMEFAPKGDLLSAICRQYRLCKPDFLSSGEIHGTLFQKLVTYKICLQMILALEYMHGKKVIHTDIKTDNILLFSLDPEDQINVKLADYGIAHGLDEAGVRGFGGLHVFCAPEIMKGKAFDEKVDIFSLGMLIYNLMTGSIPFEDITDCVQVRRNISGGRRPQFSNRDYKMIPHFDFLKATMEGSWQESPHLRPSASAILEVMRDPSFLCLEHVIELTSVSETCLYSTVSSDFQTKEYYQIWQWQGEGELRSFMECDTRVMTHKTHNIPGSRVSCAMAFGNTHIIGIMDESGCAAIDVYHYKNEQARFGRLSHVAKRKVRSTVTSLCYDGAADEASSNLRYLFVGQKDGTIAIFKPRLIQIESNTDVLSFCHHPKILTLGITPQPCQCMHMSNNNTHVIVGCGNHLKFIATKEQLLEESTIVVSVHEDDVVECIGVRNDDIWCCIRGSSLVLNYSWDTKQLITSLQTNVSVPSRFICGPTNEAFIMPHSLSAENSQRNNMPRSSDSRRIEIESMKIVDDTLWIGRSDGCILVVNIDRDAPQICNFGQLFAVLVHGPISNQINQGGSIKNLYAIGQKQIAAYCEVDETRKLVVWERWNAQKFQYFANILSSQIGV